MNITLLTLMLTLLALPLHEAQAHTGATGVVKERMDNFKASKTSMKAIKKALKKGDFDVVLNETSSIHAWSIVLVDFFPQGSNPVPSEASDQIWNDFTYFKRLATDQTEAAASLRQAAEKRNKALTLDAFYSLSKTCKNCHDRFRD